MGANLQKIIHIHSLHLHSISTFSRRARRTCFAFSGTLYFEREKTHFGIYPSCQWCQHLRQFLQTDLVGFVEGCKMLAVNV